MGQELRVLPPFLEDVVQLCRIGVQLEYLALGLSRLGGLVLEYDLYAFV